MSASTGDTKARIGQVSVVIVQLVFDTEFLKLTQGFLTYGFYVIVITRGLCTWGAWFLRFSFCGRFCRCFCHVVKVLFELKES